ncbi:MAG: efflux RND transporter permease subunit [Gemmatimonadota bacterium]|nr:efflux RND transporter permease subunit [Gemmatimonadota bacterium]
MNRAIAWMARHGVAANLLMGFLVVSGVVSMLSLTQEVFPEFDLDLIQVQVPYPGATPSEVEEAIVRRIEERIEGVDGVKEVTSVASENVGVVTAELALGTDARRALDDVKSEVDRITAFPDEAEEPQVQQLTNRRRVIDVAFHGNVPERTLKEIAARVQDDLTAMPEISFAQVTGVRDYEISIEVPRDVLRAYDLSLPAVAAAVRAGSLELPAGTVETGREEVRVRVEGRNYTRADFERVVIRSRPDGSLLRLGDIAEIEDAFDADADRVTRYDGEPAALVQVFRSGDEQVLGIVEAVEDYLEQDLRPTLPAGVETAIWENEAENLESRLNLLIRNGILGLCLVLIALTLFLDLRLSFWTAVGIAVSFLGTFAVMAVLGKTINLISLFGFILAIGIVVDDAIVVGENIFSEYESGKRGVDAAIAGARRVASPVTFAVMTTIVAFTPLLFVPGMMGKFIDEIPTIVILVLAFSLVESLLILPHHLSGLSPREEGEASRFAIVRWIERVQGKVSGALERFVEGPLERGVRYATTDYGMVLAGATAVVLVVVGLVAGGWIRFSFLPQVEGDIVIASLEMEPGTPVERTLEVADRIQSAGREAAAALEEDRPDDAPELLQATFTTVGSQPSSEQGPGGQGGGNLGRSNVAEVAFRLLEPDRRDLSSKTFEREWRDRMGEVAGARNLTFSSNLVSFGAAVQVEMSHPDPALLAAAVADVREELATFAGVYDVTDDQAAARRELELELTARGRTLGVTLEDLARQVRAAFFGTEALRVQRGREEVRVYVRLPERERNAIADLRDYRVRVPGGGFAPLGEVADVELAYGPSTIRRREGRRVVTVTADVDRSVVTGGEVTGKLEEEVLPAIVDRYPDLDWEFGGEQEEQREVLGGVGRNFLVALFVIFTLLAIPFRSYLQPLVVMASIPLGFVGAALGHLIMNMPLTMLSLFGIVGLAGVVVNDSLVLIDFVNEERRGGKPMGEAIVSAAKIRFRPILLTSITTFLSVFPLIMESSVQAQFLVPMAISIGYGILLATAILMLVVPALAMLEHDAATWVKARWPGREPEPARARGD